jgi:hypothetical protein
MLNLFQGVLSGFGRTRVLPHAPEDQFKCILILEKNIVILKNAIIYYNSKLIKTKSEGVSFLLLKKMYLIIILNY